MMNSSNQQWQAQLQKHGFVQFKAYLPYQQASQFRAQILKSHHMKAWKLLTTPYRPLMAMKDRISTGVNNKTRCLQAERARKRGQFSFSFYRSTNKHASQHGRQFIHQEVAAQLAKDICPQLGLSGEIRDSFFARFERGQFISYHKDAGAGQYAFIYQLSKGWQYQYGGQLVLYSTRSRFYRKKLAPEFNTLTLLKLDHPMPHSVQMLNNPKHKHRLTISGWLE